MAMAIAAHAPGLLVLASRTKSKIEQVADKIEQSHPGTPVKVVVVDLSSQESVKTAAAEIAGLVERIDVLINNAGVVTPKHTFTAQGIEMQFATNHVGPFLLTNLLMPKIRQAAREAADADAGATRIVNVTSRGHTISPLRFSDYNFQKRTEELPAAEQVDPKLHAVFGPKEGETYATFYAYAQSKTANVLTSRYLTDSLGDAQGILSFSVHPGSIWTDLSRNLDEEALNVINSTGGYWKGLDEGSATMIVAAFDPALNASRDVYLAECQIDEAAPHADDPALAERLWHLSEELVGQKFELGQSN